MSDDKWSLQMSGALCVLLFVAGAIGFFVEPKWGFGFLAVSCGYCMATGILEYWKTQ